MMLTPKGLYSIFEEPPITPAPTAATQRLKQLLPFSQTIALRQITIDRYGQTIAEAYRNGQSVGLTLVSEGYAVVYHRYLDGCSETEGEFFAAEEQAKVQRLHYWRQDAVVMPWDFRWGRG